MKMSETLALTFDWHDIRVLDAKTGECIDTYNGERISVRHMLGNEWADHKIYSICPGCEYQDGKPQTFLQIWIEA